MINKKDLADSIWESNKEMSRNQSMELVDSIFDRIINTLKSGQDVHIYGLGTFCIRSYGSRKTQNPRTQEPIIVPPYSAVRFRAVPKLRKL